MICVSAKDDIDTRLGMIREGADDYVTDEKAVTVHVSNLRNKLKHGEDYIKTVWGIGYKMQDLKL